MLLRPTDLFELSEDVICISDLFGRTYKKGVLSSVLEMLV